MILNRVVFSLAFIMQHTFTNAWEPIRGEEGEKIEGSHHNHQDSNHSMDTITSYLRGDSKYSTMSNIRSEMSDRNLGGVESCNISSGTYFIQSVSHGTYMKISNDGVTLTKPDMGPVYDNSYIRSLGNNEYAIQSLWLEKYVRVQKSGKYRTVDTQNYAGSKERFYITCFDNGDYAFKSKKYRNYLRADEGAGWYKIDTYTSSKGDNEKWRLITKGVHAPSPKPEKTYYIKSTHGYYISMNNKNEVKFEKHNRSYERITLRSMCDISVNKACDIYALKSATHGERYLSIPDYSRWSEGLKVGAQSFVTKREEFYMETLSDGRVTFKSRLGTGTYLCANDNDKNKLYTRWEWQKAVSKFTLIPV